MTKQIYLSQGLFAIVDDYDYNELSKYKWSASNGGHTFYASRRTSGKNGASRKTIHMHTQIMNPPKGMIVDHADGNGLNNTRENLRISTLSQNQFNKRIGLNNTSGYKGVSWHKNKNTWRASIRHNGINIDLGSYDSAIEAGIAYNRSAIDLFGEYAKLNDIPEWETKAITKRAQKFSQSGVTGVYIKGNKFSVQINRRGKRFWGGTFDTIEDAKCAYQKMIMEMNNE